MAISQQVYSVNFLHTDKIKVFNCKESNELVEYSYYSNHFTYTAKCKDTLQFFLFKKCVTCIEEVYSGFTAGGCENLSGYFFLITSMYRVAAWMAPLPEDC